MRTTPYLDIEMKHIHHLSYLLIFVLVISSCQKVELDPDSPSTSPSPVFSANVMVNGEEDLIEVGTNAILSAYHHSIGESSYLGTAFTDPSGNDILSFEFSFITPFDQLAFSQPIEFGSLECYYELDVTNVQTTFPIMNYVWSVNQQFFTNTNAVITSYGEYDITLFAELIDGTQVQLKDRVTLGGLEANEPEISASENNPSEFLLTPLNYSSAIDSVRWEIEFQSYPVISSSSVNFNFTLPSPVESFVAHCYFYVDGEENYTSQMFASVLYPSAPLVSMDQCIGSVENQALPLFPRGKATYNYNGDVYATRDGQFSIFQVTNISSFLDEYTLETYLKGSLAFSSYVYNSAGDSVYVDVSSEIGFLEMPD